MQALDSFLQTLGAWGYVLLGAAALIEYLFPPFPGDTVVVLGGTWAEREQRSLVIVCLALIVGSQVGMAVMWAVGRALAEKLRLAPEGARVLGLPVGPIRKAQALMHRRGTWFLLGNRFLPSARSIVFLAAGAAEVSLGRTLLFGSISAVAFNAVLVWVGYSVGNNAQAIADFFSRFRLLSWSLAAAIIIVLLARFFLKRARAQSRP